MALQEFEEAGSQAQAKRNLVRAIEAVAERLGNTAAVCKKCYIHPFILDSYLDGTMAQAFQKPRDREVALKNGSLKPEEQSVLNFLQKRLAAERKNSRSTLLEKLEASIKHRRSPKKRKKK
jgi:DNA topoisomerase-1